VSEVVGASMRPASDLPVVDVRLGNGRRARTAIGRDAFGGFVAARTVHQPCQAPSIGQNA